MGMNKADILAICIKEEIDCLPEDDYLRVSAMVDDLSDLADPNAEVLKWLKKAIEYLIEDGDFGGSRYLPKWIDALRHS